ncbi:MGMT family protein [bacterium]|nr:MGMT family protein [bacterium]
MASFDFPRHPAACSQLEWEVYQATVSIPYGEVLSYGQVAAQCGRPGGARWVGTALGRNPWPPLIPCHRVVGKAGQMVGFSAPGGVHTKRRLLELESGVSQLRLF